MFALPPVTQALIIANCAIFFLDSSTGGSLSMLFALWPPGAQFMPWQVLTYAFLHGGLSHLAFNMFGLYMFGGDVERVWGSQRFLYFIFSAPYSRVSPNSSLPPQAVGTTQRLVRPAPFTDFCWPSRVASLTAW